MKRIFLPFLCAAAAFWTAHAAAPQIATVTHDHVNVRGKPSLVGEVITQLKRGEKVTILEEIEVEKPQPGEPKVWARIQLPANTPVWVSADFIDPTSRTVTASRLNLRGGPGENYSIVGRIERGDPVKTIRTLERWMEIEAPEVAYAYTAAEFLAKEQGSSTIAPPDKPIVAASEKTPPPPPLVPPPKVEKTDPEPPPPAEATAQTQATIQPPPKEDPSTPPKVTTPETAQIVKPEDPVTPAGPISDPASQKQEPPSDPVPPPVVAETPADPPPAITLIPEETPETPSKRIVRREGLVRGTLSIQAPSYFELISPQTRKTINYLHTEDPALKLKDFKGRMIIVTGEEAIDPRWPATPVLDIQTLELAP